MISARSRGLPAIAVPGGHAWEPAWAPSFSGRQVSVVMDCDRQGREAAARIASDLREAGAIATVVDLAPERADGFDLTDWLAERPRATGRELAVLLGWSTSLPTARSGAARELAGF